MERHKSRERRDKKEKKRSHADRDSSDGEKKNILTPSQDKKRKDGKADDEKPEKFQTLPDISDLEEGGLDLSKHLRPISAYIQERREMLEQCFLILRENKLKNMLPDEFKDCPLSEVQKLCWDQLQQLSDAHLLDILEGKELSEQKLTDTQQDSNIDSTSCLRENTDADDKHGSGEESDVLSINADVDDSDIEVHKVAKPEKPNAEAPPPAAPAVQSAEPKVEIQQDIDRSVSEILALATPGSDPTASDRPTNQAPSAQQLDLLELEMRARAIKALMKAGEVKKTGSA